METKKEIGFKGEAAAIDFLQKAGFKILFKNYRFKRSEIDIIFSDGLFLVFAEVKYRFDSSFGFSESFVSANQEEKIREGADQFLLENDWPGPIRFDIISIQGRLKTPIIEHFKDAF